MANHNASTALLNNAVVSPCRSQDFIRGETVEKTLPWVLVTLGTTQYVAPATGLGIAADWAAVYPAQGQPQFQRDKPFPDDTPVFYLGGV